MSKDNKYKLLRESTETNDKKALTQEELTQVFESEGNPLKQSTISKLETCKKEPASTSVDVLKAYTHHFHVTSDYLLGLAENKYADENYQMITRITGLTDESIDCLKTLKFDDDKLKLLNLLIGNYELFSELLQNLDVVFFQKKTMELNIYDPSFASIYAYTRIANILNKYGEVIDSENV